MTRDLPPQANLEHLRKQAKELLRAVRERRPDAVERYRVGARRPAHAQPTLADAQHVVAREYGFATWAALKAHVEAAAREGDPRAALVDAVRRRDPRGARALFRRHPALAAALHEPVPDGAFGELPLAHLVALGDETMIDVFLDAGADINARSRWWAGGFGVLDTCAPALAPFLIARGARVDAHAAARLGMLDVLRELVGADPSLVHARGGDGQTPLHFAATVEIARFLVEHGADVDARDVDHESTPAQWMVRDRQDVARFLVSRGCGTDLFMAAALGDLALARRHLDDDPGAVGGRVAAERFPMRDRRAGGTIYYWTLGRNWSPHRAAREFGHDDVLRLLLDRSPDDVRLRWACESGDADAVAALTAARPSLGRDLSRAEPRALVDAAMDRNAAAVRLLLAAGWPVDARGQHAATPLHWAAWHGDVAMLREILRHAPPIEARDADFGKTALGWAVHASRRGWHPEDGDYAGVVTALLDAGAAPPDDPDGVDATDAVRAALRR